MRPGLGAKRETAGAGAVKLFSRAFEKPMDASIKCYANGCKLRTEIVKDQPERNARNFRDSSGLKRKLEQEFYLF